MYDNNSVLNSRWNQNGKISINPEHIYGGNYATKTWGDKEPHIMGLFCKRVEKRYDNEGFKHVLTKFKITFCHGYKRPIFCYFYEHIKEDLIVLSFQTTLVMWLNVKSFIALLFLYLCPTVLLSLLEAILINYSLVIKLSRRSMKPCAMRFYFSLTYV